MVEIIDLLDWNICGRLIGRASGWDQADTFVFTIYDLQAGAGYKGPVGCVVFDFERGLVEGYDNEGKVLQSVDLLEAIGSCPINR